LEACKSAIIDKNVRNYTIQAIYILKNILLSDTEFKINFFGGDFGNGGKLNQDLH
jgi:hypothetical protein